MSPTPPVETVNSWVQWRSLVMPDEEAVVCYDEDLRRSSLSFVQLDQLASRFAFLLKENGVKKGDNVVIALPNCMEQVVVDLGIILAGAVSVPVEVFLNTGDTFFEVLEKTKTKCLIVNKDDDSCSYNLIKNTIDQPDTSKGCHFAKVKANAKTFNLQSVCVLTRDGQGHGLIQLLQNACDSYQCQSIAPDDPCQAVSTASADSMVRLVLHSHGSTVRTYLNIGKGYITKVGKLLSDNEPTWPSNFPTDMVVRGLTRVITDHWSEIKKDYHELLADVIEKEDVDYAFMVPPTAEKVAAKWRPRPYPVFKHLWTGGMPVNEDCVKRMMPIAARITVRYMSSEMFSISYNSFTKDTDFKDFDCGVMEEGCQVRIVNDKMQDVRPGEQGRLLLKASLVFQRYLGEPPQATSSRFTPDGFYISYDGGHVRPRDGNLFVMGRNDDMISHKVWVLHPSWLEKDFKLHPGVDQAVVVPIPHRVNHHNICACLVRKAGSPITAQDMKRHFSECYVDKEKDSFGPSDVLFLDKLPQTTTGRVDRQRAKEIAVKVVTESNSRGIDTDDLKTINIDQY